MWDYWHVPDQYTLLRTPADQYFPEEDYQRLEDALLDYGEQQLGCRGISPIWLSYYVDGCRQVTHCALKVFSMLTLNHSPLCVVAAGMSFVVSSVYSAWASP